MAILDTDLEEDKRHNIRTKYVHRSHSIWFKLSKQILGWNSELIFKRHGQFHLKKSKRADLECCFSIWCIYMVQSSSNYTYYVLSCIILYNQADEGIFVCLCEKLKREKIYNGPSLKVYQCILAPSITMSSNNLWVAAKFCIALHV